MVTVEQLKKCMPTCKQPEVWVPLLNTYLTKYKLNSKDDMARFIAQCGHESGDFNTLKENLNYSAERLLVVFPKYFRNMPSHDLQQYHRKPEKIANRVYASRMGNGDEKSGDGWKYKGSGIIQLTGKFNYTKCSDFLFDDDRLVKTPEIVMEPECALLSAIWFWESNKLKDIKSFVDLTKRINGGTHGLACRQDRYNRALAVL
jgi:putative chitinase